MTPRLTIFSVVLGIFGIVVFNYYLFGQASLPAAQRDIQPPGARAIRYAACLNAPASELCRSFFEEVLPRWCNSASKDEGFLFDISAVDLKELYVKSQQIIVTHGGREMPPLGTLTCNRAS